MKIDAKKLLQQKVQNKQAVGAFNVSSLEAIKGVMQAAAESKRAILIETSRGESEYLGPELLAKTVEQLAKEYGVDYALHLDRAQKFDWIKKCLDAGYNSVTAESTNPEKKMSVEETLKIRELADKYGAALEGAMEVVPLRYYAGQDRQVLLSSPTELKEFAQATGVDSLVISLGTQSGARKTVKTVHFEILEEANQLMPELPFVLHGGSFLDDDIVKKLIDGGISKINVNSELRLAYTDKLKQNLHNSPDEYAPYRLLAGVEEAIKQVALTKINLFSNH